MTDYLANVNMQLQELAKYWESLGPKRWFLSSQENDAELTTKYGELYDYIRNPNQDNSTGRPQSKHEWLGYVILFDQIRRHVNRHRGTCDGLPGGTDAFIRECKTMFEYHGSTHEELTDFEFMFLLFPIRHTNLLANVQYVVDKTWARLEAQGDQPKQSAMLRNYLTATYERYNKLGLDDITENIEVYEPYNGSSPVDDSGYLITRLDSFRGLFDPQCSAKFTINKHLQQVDLTNPLVDIMRRYMDTYPVKDTKCTWNIPIVSLSGGVDSMVCSYILHLLGIKFACVHINYMNRAECAEEERFLRYWCEYIIRVPLYVRQIREINRPQCMANGFRDLYESYTHNVRFDTYVNVGEFVMLGHNHDDTVENTLTNLAARSHYDNLLGMREYMEQTHRDEPLKLLRPLLGVSKSEIYQFAEQFTIPYFVDSTPKWSQRGKIRDIVRPAIQAWNPQLITGITTLSSHLSDMTSLLTDLIGRGPESFPSLGEIPANPMYWQTLFRNRQLQVTQRTLVELCNKIVFLQKRPEKLVLNQPVKFTLCKNTTLEFMRNRLDQIQLTIRDATRS
jgi:tRNA(Ile)-lysidine synthase TilS/MesJ/uncharacterized protein (DUF924 family)